MTCRTTTKCEESSQFSMKKITAPHTAVDWLFSSW